MSRGKGAPKPSPPLKSAPTPSAPAPLPAPAPDTHSQHICLTRLESREEERLRAYAASFRSTQLVFVDSVTPGCILVTPEVSRTIKCCAAFTVGKGIVTPRWLEESARAGVLLLSSMESYMPPMARELAERGLRGERSMENRRRGLGVKILGPPWEGLGLLAGYAVYLPVGMPSREDLGGLVQRLGGLALTTVAQALAAAPGSKRGGGGAGAGAGAGAGRVLVALAVPGGAAGEDVARLGAAGALVLKHHWLVDTALAQETLAPSGAYAHTG